MFPAHAERRLLIMQVFDDGHQYPSLFAVHVLQVEYFAVQSPLVPHVAQVEHGGGALPPVHVYAAPVFTTHVLGGEHLTYSTPERLTEPDPSAHQKLPFW